MSINTQDDLLKKLAVALTEMPRANTKEIAEMAGISRATFNRFCGSRDNLIKMIMEQAEYSLQIIKTVATENVEEYHDAINKLIDAHFDNQEYLIFLCGVQNSLENPFWDEYLKALDIFFLNGQKHGVFRLDIPAQMMTELFVSLICGMIDADRRGRIASSSMMRSMSSFFFDGISHQ